MHSNRLYAEYAPDAPIWRFGSIRDCHSNNAFIGSFNGKFRAECLNSHWFMSISFAPGMRVNWRCPVSTDVSILQTTLITLLREHCSIQDHV
ncbi:integrase core domain-containing protein [Rhodobacteraceae bacterium NNCM2]|nr:integrase core domain-containing protein [Coraliihabitans acroporae]